MLHQTLVQTPAWRIRDCLYPGRGSPVPREGFACTQGGGRLYPGRVSLQQITYRPYACIWGVECTLAVIGTAGPVK
eukprot:3200982-Pyramimonas_sp.AAC.1